ncbi:MAG: hypothetical protein IKU38_00345 [Clostridia bacterium]|nr:hypothetical protein [Clostridia bacterium]
MKKHPNLSGLARLALFLLGFALLIAFANTHLIQTDTIARLTIHEMQQRSDIELALVGSSIVRDHFNAQMITEKTGLNTFCATVPTASMPASIALTRELFKTNSPEWVVLVTEPYNFITVQEAKEAQYKLMPFLTDPANMLDYYLRTCDEDNAYLDRLMMFRGFGAKSIADVAKTIGLRYFPQQTYERLKADMDPTVSYQGSGFLRHETDERAHDLFKTVIREYTEYAYELLPESIEQLETYKQLCEENGARLMVVVYPNHTAHGLAEIGFMENMDSLMKVCRQLELPCYNFTFAKPELMPNLDEYFFDLYHMVGEGADMLSSAFARVFNGHAAGEDMSALFHANIWEYRDSIDFATNCWITVYDPDVFWTPALYHDQARVMELAKDQDVYLADCNHWRLYTPEYKFVLLEEDGSETLLLDYGTDNLYACAPGALSGKTLRLYARIADHEENGEVYYDLPIE